MTGNSQLREIDVGQIIPDPFQPRRTFLDDEIRRMADSIHARGVLQPLRVRRDESRQCFVIISGETRWRGAKLDGQATVPCLVIEGDATEADNLTDQIIENTVRNDLTPMQEARALARLRALEGGTAQALATKIGISNSSFHRAGRLLSLPEPIQHMVDAGTVPASAAAELSRLDDEAAQFELAHLIASKRMTRDQATDAVRDRIASVKPPKQRLSCKHDGVSISVSAGGKLTLDKLNAAIEVLRKEAKKLVEAKQVSQQAG